ncbi:MAG: sigma-70 family RNA polymerase sigma factor [Chloroflexi bacterium]|nr:sigma-70 family RNA polymerase sigma factor [Chloroflexota bacterium]
MLLPDHSALIALCLRILQQLSRQEPELGLSDERLPGLAHRSASRLSDNLANGRFSYVCARGHLSGTDEEQLASYAANVCRVYAQEGNLIGSLQAGEDEAWQRVLKRLVRLAFNKYLGKGAYDWALWEAQALANETASELWRRLQSPPPYPFDVPFDRWCARILLHRFIDRDRVQKRRDLWCPASLDEPLWPGSDDGVARVETTGGWPMNQWLENYANREWLLQTIEGLRNPLERQAIWLYYLKERSVKEVAEELGVSENYVYVLLHRARRRLRQILKSDERFRR